MADNVVQTIFTADATQAVAAAEAASAATTKAVAKMQEAASKPLSYQSAAQPGSINNPLGRQTVAQREAAQAAQQAAKAASSQQAAVGGVSAATAAYAKSLASANAATLDGIGRAKEYGKAMSFVRENVQRVGGAVLLAFGTAKVLDAFINRAENINSELQALTESATKFGQTALFGAKSKGLDDTKKQIQDLRTSAQSEIEKLQKDTAESQSAYANILKAAFGLGAGTDEKAAAAVAAIDKINAQVNAAAKEIEKSAAEDKAKEKKKADDKLASESKARAKDVQADADKLAAESIEGERERAKALQQLEQKRIADELADATKSKEEQDALFALSKASYAKYQSDLTKITEAESEKREEANKQAVQQMIADWEALRGAIDSAYQAQQQFSSSQFSFGSDIRAIRQLLEVRGGWKN